jgi:hypothetical protein
MRIRRLACSMIPSTYRRAPLRVTVSKKSQASSASAWKRRKLAQVEEVRSGAGSIPACCRIPNGGGRDLDAEDEELAVDAPVAPAGILPRQARHQQADGADGARPARTAGAGPGRVAARQDVPVPVQHRLWTDQQPEPAKHVPPEAVQQRGQERPIGRAEPRPGLTKLPLQDRDLVDVAPGSPRPCPGRSPEEAAVTRTRSSQPGRPVEAAQPIIMPQRADLRRATSLSGLCRNRIAPPTWADEIFGTGSRLP